MNELSPHLLKAALSPSDSDATACWRAWRDAIDVEHISWPELQFIPILNGRRLNEWLIGDPASGVFRGIVRRTWLEAQVRLKLAQETIEIVGQALRESLSSSIETDSSVLIGPAGNYLRALNQGSVRPLSELRLLIRRQHLADADAALLNQGWVRYGEIPRRNQLDWWTYIAYNLEGTQLCLHWRALPVGGAEAAACECEFLAGSRVVQATEASLRILAPEHALLEALADKRDFGSVDVIPWQADAAAIAKEQIDWRRWTELAARFCPFALERIPELRALGVDIPDLPQTAIPHAGDSRIAARFLSLKRRAGRWARRALAVARGR
jgi:hypothetical protein